MPNRDPRPGGASRPHRRQAVPAKPDPGEIEPNPGRPSQGQNLGTTQGVEVQFPDRFLGAPRNQSLEFSTLRAVAAQPQQQLAALWRTGRFLPSKIRDHAAGRP